MDFLREIDNSGSSNPFIKTKGLTEFAYKLIR